MVLKKYKQKRNFGPTAGSPAGKHGRHVTTTEPKPERKKSSGSLPVFVVQKHAASRLHFDFRLENKGVLLSWAIPKGPSVDEDVRRLAVHVEDHPLDYAKFSGNIPKGQYGAGKVQIWDHGFYTYPGLTNRKEVEEMIEKGMRKGHVKVELKGRKLKGLFSIIKFEREQNKQDNWLFFKMHDEFAVRQKPVVVNKKLKDYIGHLDLISRRINFPEKIKPMLATLIEEPFSKPGWLFEMKLDGFRAKGEVRDKESRLVSRNGIDISKDFQSITDSIARLPYEAVFDGELVVLDTKGRADFQLMQRYKKTGEGDLVYYVFDLLYLEGHDLTKLPLSSRKSVLKDLIPLFHNIRLLDHIETRGERFFGVLKEAGIEGMVAKRKDSEYQPGVRSKDWLKVKVGQVREVIIVGYTKPEGSRNYFGALAVAEVLKGKLVYLGNVGTGFSESDLKKIAEMLRGSEDNNLKMQNKPKGKNITFVEPQIWCSVHFLELTEDNLMRHPKFLGLLENKKVKVPSALQEQESTARQFKNKEEFLLEKIGSHNVKITHPGKIYWPKYGYTKEDMIAYYKTVSRVMLPYLQNRPITMHRFPDGVSGEGFFHKDVVDEHPTWVKTHLVSSKSAEKNIHYLLCQNPESLIYMANLGTIEIHPWHSRIGNLNNPDYFVIDLDPHGIGFDKVIETANTVHELLEEFGIPSFPKTSGFTGLHIYIPLGAKYSYKQAINFGQILSGFIHAKLPEITSEERDPDKRPAKIYLDIYQNRKGQTIVAPYSLRPGIEATVSTPLNWSEVNSKLNPVNFTIKTVPLRLERYGDLFTGIMSKGIDLQKILKTIEKKSL